ncbi:hypothetical protein D9M73_153010 [compost metagenome]
MAGTDDLDGIVTSEQFLERLRQVRHCRGRCFLDENIALLGVLERVQNQVNRILERHQEACHVRVSDGQRLTALQLIDEQRDHRTTGCHDVTVAGCANHRACRRNHPRFGNHQLFSHGLGNAHGIDWVYCFVGTEYDNALHARSNSRIQNVLGTHDVGTHGFHRVKLAGRHLLQGGGVEDVIHPHHRLIQAVAITHVTDVELHLVIRQGNAHIFLLLLVTAEYTNLFYISIQKTLQHRMAKRARTARDHQNLIIEHNYLPKPD